MKIYLLLLFLVMLKMNLYSQTFSKTFNVCDKSFTVITEKQADNSIHLKLSNTLNDTVSKNFTIKTSDIQVFANTFQQAFFAFVDDTTLCSPTQKDEVLGIGRNIFIDIISSNTDAEKPEAGTLSLEKNISCELFSSKGLTNLTSEELSKAKTNGDVVKMRFEINSAYFENIKVYVTIKGTLYYFTNLYSIGISNRKNIKSFKDMFLYSLPNKSGNIYKIRLGDLFTYDYNIELNRKDYSPQDIATEVQGGQSIKLFKDATNKLFEAQIYTDFLGLNENRPNGLIQTEASKKINISTVQKQMPRPFFLVVQSVGSFQFITPNITLSKIEQHNKHLILANLDSLKLNPGVNDTTKFGKNLHRFTTPLSIYQYQTFSAGLDLNIINLSNHDLKYNLYFNIGAKLGLTSVTDSLTKIENNVITKTGFVSNYTVTSLQWYPSATLVFFPEERFSLTLSDKIVHLKAYNSNFEQLSFDKTDNRKVTIPTHRWLNIFEMLMTIRVNSDSKLFGRVKYNYELKNINNNFAQVQVGYSTYILGKK